MSLHFNFRCGNPAPESLVYLRSNTSRNPKILAGFVATPNPMQRKVLRWHPGTRFRHQVIDEANPRCLLHPAYD